MFLAFIASRFGGGWKTFHSDGMFRHQRHSRTGKTRVVVISPRAVMPWYEPNPNGRYRSNLRKWRRQHSLPWAR